MAKTQTFGDKTKKKKAEEKMYVKVVKGVPSPKTGSLRFLETFVSVKDLAELDKMDFTK
ncbi:MAG: DUF4295 family protein [Candidatus Kapabacteria bacterium]|nr:DUF4295 family protein [Candidatus Kapabacteria bacterium]